MSEIELIEMHLREIQATDGPGPQIMILAESGGVRRFPIFIGPFEMEALDRAVHRKDAQRPLTHDLILNTIEGMGGELKRVVIDDLRADTFFAKLVVRTAPGETALIDSRPSDALVLAVRRAVPIYVAEHVLDAITRHEADNEDDL